MCVENLDKIMEKKRVAVVGYGNIGKFTVEAIEASCDMEIAGIVRRNVNDIPEEIKKYKVVSDIKELEGVDVAILATPTRKVEEYAKEILAMGINTADSYDIHSGITQLRANLDKVAKENGSGIV